MEGVWNKVLKVDLTKKKVEIVQVPDDVYKKYGLGLGIATYFLYKDTPEKTNSLGPENTIVISPGLFVGIGVPTGSKTAVTFKSPLTGGFGRAIAGAYLGVSLRRSGYDALIVKGRSDHWVAIKIDEESAEIIDAREWKGLDAIRTQEVLREKFGKEFRTCAIGRAGENLSLIAGIDFEERQAARGGGGAVFGSKNLKAIIVKGTKTLKLHKGDDLKELNKKWAGIIKDHPATKADMGYGSGEWYEWANRERGTFPSKNWQWGYFQSVYDNLKDGEKAHLDPYYWSPKYTERHHPCPTCTKPCGRIIAINEGKYAGTRVDGIEYEVLYSLGGMLVIDDAEAVAKMNEVCDREGFDAISAGVTLAWGMEAYEKGLLDKGKMEGIELAFGNADAAIVVLQKMAKREGYIGELLGDGVKKAVERLGKNSDQFAIHIKGLELPAYDVRGIKGLALAFAVSVRGGCHLTAGVYGVELGGSWWKFKGVDRLSSDWKGYEVKAAEDFATAYDIFGICKFSRHMYFLEGIPELNNAVTGLELTNGDIMMLGERVYNLQKMFNVREGMDRRNDHLPYRVTHEPIPKGVSKGAMVTEDELQHMLDEYYTARGWSRNGTPTNVKLASLDLLDLVPEEFGAGI
jgi:aldehyde:ferredoxin oxidoreductase